MAIPAAAVKPRTPPGIKWSNVWRTTTDGALVEGDREMPVDAKYNLFGQLWLCQKADCPTERWTFEDGEEAGFCDRDGAALVATGVDPASRDGVSAARTGLTAKVRDAVVAKRDRLIGEAAARAAVLRAEAEAATRQTAVDMHDHVPSLIATGAGMAGAVALALTTDTLVTAGSGLAVLSAGTVVAYAVAYPLLKRSARKRAEADGEEVAELVERKTRKVRGQSRQIAGGVFALGSWTVLVSLTGVNPGTPAGAAALMAGCVAAWVANRVHWDELWTERRRLRALAKLRAENAARRAQEEADRLASGPATPAPAAADEEENQDTPEAAGRRLAAEWSRIAASPDVPSGFQMRRTRILAAETREVTIPGTDGPVRIGFEFAGECDPGALVARSGMQAPLQAAAAWLASMMNRDPSTLAVVDRPTDDKGEVRPNRFLVVLTDRAPLGASVPWKGKAGIRVAPDGTIYAHAGRTLTGDHVEEIMYSPGKPFGGLTVGTTGGGKSAGTILRILNTLAAGIFPILDDPKNLVDYGDFIGLFPIGVTSEHAQVILASLSAERKRRERRLATRPVLDKHGRVRPGGSTWDLADGPPILAIFEEFHERASDPSFYVPLTAHVRFQRAAAMGADAVTQAGGLQDMASSVLRGLLSLARLRLYRSTDASAALAGYRGNYLVSSLPRVPGVCLDVTEEAPPLPLRAAYVSRDINDDRSVYDQLYGPNMEPLLTAPALPKETIDVFRREGLMDLWDLGKGPNGLSNLLGDTANYAPTASEPANSAGAMLAVDVLLAIIHSSPGCTRAAVDAHTAWTTAPGWNRTPVASTVSRRINDLVAAGLIIKDGSGSLHVTEKGATAGAPIAAALFGTPPSAADDDPPPA